jgi:hypothetical protein
MKKQQSRGRANRRYQAAKKDFRKRPIPTGWSKAHRAWMESLETPDLTIDQEIAAYGDGTIIDDRPGLSRLPQTDDALNRERLANAGYDKWLEKRGLSPRL